MDNLPKDEAKDKDEQTDEMERLQRLESIETQMDNKPSSSETTSSFTPTIPAGFRSHEPTVVVPVPSHNDSLHDDSDSHAAKRFLIAYIASIFSALSLLFSTSYLVYVLLDHFISEKKDAAASLFYFDLAPLYISTMASIMVFSVLYIVSTHYVAKSAANDTIGLRDWRVYKIVYSFFSASLLIIAASVLGSLLYIPLAQMMIAEDLTNTQITIQVLSGLHVLLWIALLIWQERLVKNGRHAMLQGIVVILIAIAVVVLTAIFPVGSKADERRDHRTENDLSSIQTEIETYRSDHKDALPVSLSDLKFDNDSKVKDRLSHYSYMVKTVKPEQTDAEKRLKALQEAYGTANVGAQVGTDTGSLDSQTYAALFSETPSEESQAPTKSYELCATFKTDTTKKDKESSTAFSSISSAFGSSSYSFDSHKAGQACFTRT